MCGCRSCLGCDEFWLADQIVAGHRQGELLKPSFSTPRSMGRASPPIVLPRPNGSSMRFLFRWLTA